jgi:hypothetical protein
MTVGCDVCAITTSAAYFTSTLSDAVRASHVVTHPTEWLRTSTSARHRALCSVSFASILRQRGWFPHQHRSDGVLLTAETPESLVCSSLSDSQTTRLQNLADLIYSIFVQTPPLCPAPDLHPSQAPDGSVPLPWSSTARPDERTFTRPNDDDAPIIWRAIISEIAAGWAVSQAGLSYGLCFLGPKHRFIYWPRLANFLLGHLPVVYGRVFDLFTILSFAGMKIDIKSAYRLISLHPDDIPYMGAVIDGVCVLFTRLPFGLSPAPAIFCNLMAVTLDRYRASMPSCASALSSFVDDVAISDLGVDDLITSGERLVRAFAHDGWWLSIAKIYLWPCTRLSYIGFAADFADHSVCITESKANKLMMALRGVTRPSDALILRLHQDASSPVSSISSSVVAASATPGCYIIDVSLAPVSAWRRRPLFCFRIAAAYPNLLSVVPTRTFPVFAVATVISSISTALAVSPSIAQTIVILIPAHAISLLVHEFPHLWTTKHCVIVHLPSSDQGSPMSETSRTIFNKSDSLPPQVARAHRRHLPEVRSLILPVQDINAPIILSPQSFACLQQALGILAWFQSVLPFVGFWTYPLHRLLSEGLWDAERAAAFDDVFSLAPMMPLWGRRVRVPTSTLNIISDGGLGWGGMILSSSGRICFAGVLPAAMRLESSTAREAHAAVAAIRASFTTALAFDGVRVTSDSNNLVAANSRGCARGSALSGALRSLATFEIQGLPVEFVWQRRTDGDHPVVDALSAAALATAWLWTLRSAVVSFAWSSTGGWTIDLAASCETAWAPAYATPSISLSDRQKLLSGLSRDISSLSAPGVEENLVGWIGTSQDVPIPTGQSAFCFPPWSLIPAISRRWHESPFDLVLIAPTSPSGWWGNALRFLRSKSSTIWSLGRSASVPPVELRGHIKRDPRPLSLYHLRGVEMPPGRISLRRPLWWTRWRLTRDGDIEAHPGPRTLAEFLTAPVPSGLRISSVMLSLPVTGVVASVIPHCPPSVLPPRLSSFLSVTSPVISLPSTLSSATPARLPLSTTLSSRRGVGAHRTTAVVPRHPVSLSGFLSPPFQPLSSACQGAEHCVTEQTIIHLSQPSHSLTLHSSVPGPPRQLLSLSSWIDAVVQHAAGGRGPACAPDLPVILQRGLAEASAVVRYKSAIGSSRPLRSTRYLRQLIAFFTLQDTLATDHVVAALCVSYALQRLRKPPPLGWRPVKRAATVLADLSAVSSASGRAGYPFGPYCGSRDAFLYLQARGATSKTEHSAAWPLHLADLILCEPGDSLTQDWRSWSALVIASYFCLRIGILRDITKQMFVSYNGGWIFCWRFVSKRGGGDVLDPLAHSSVFHVTAARGPALTRIIAKFAALGPVFSRIDYISLNLFVRARVRDVPGSFDIRAYGTRIGADTEAMELQVPAAYVDAMFWWKRDSPNSTKHYYSGLNVARMFTFSEARLNMVWRHLTPARYECRLTAPLPDWVGLAYSDSYPMPNAVVAELDAAWAAEAPTIDARRRARGAPLSVPAWVWSDLPTVSSAAPPVEGPVAGSSGSSASDDAHPPGSDLSVDCGRCHKHVSRHRRGAMCDAAGCSYVLCLHCHGPLGVPLLCSAHERAIVQNAAVTYQSSDDGEPVPRRPRLSDQPVLGSAVSVGCSPSAHAPPVLPFHSPPLGGLSSSPIFLPVHLCAFPTPPHRPQFGPLTVSSPPDTPFASTRASRGRTGGRVTVRRRRGASSVRPDRGRRGSS